MTKPQAQCLLVSQILIQGVAKVIRLGRNERELLSNLVF